MQLRSAERSQVRNLHPFAKPNCGERVSPSIQLFHRTWIRSEENDHAVSIRFMGRLRPMGPTDTTGKFSW